MIVAAAIRYNGVVYSLPAPARHHNVIALMHERGAVEETPSGVTMAKGVQGFLTDDGRFMGREDAARHALGCFQIQGLKYSDALLFSEDLW